MDLRVEDNADPVPELRRLVNLWEAQALLDDEGDAAKAGVPEAERYAEARRRAPDFWELAFWTALEMAGRGEMETARREMAAAMAADAPLAYDAGAHGGRGARGPGGREAAAGRLTAGAIAVRGGYQFVAVEAVTSPTDSSQRSASMAALQPSPAAVTAWR